ncbi:MAG TPA: PEGA domain-containing protein [Pirellulales bacterium]
MIRPNPTIVCVLFALLACTSTGCVQRRLLIRSNPPLARVFVGDQEVGVTPVAVNFTYYGSRQIKLVRDGCETLTDEVHLPAPWYEWTPIDFVSENVVPWTIVDRREITYNLQPQLVVPISQLEQRASEMRRAGQVPVGPLPPTVGGPAPRPPVTTLPPGAKQ